MVAYCWVNPYMGVREVIIDEVLVQFEFHKGEVAYRLPF
jgi:hypothetical protein